MEDLADHNERYLSMPSITSVLLAVFLSRVRSGVALVKTLR
jgi:hypothetical protein